MCSQYSVSALKKGMVVTIQEPLGCRLWRAERAVGSGLAPLTGNKFGIGLVGTGLALSARAQHEPVSQRRPSSKPECVCFRSHGRDRRLKTVHVRKRSNSDDGLRWHGGQGKPSPYEKRYADRKGPDKPLPILLESMGKPSPYECTLPICSQSKGQAQSLWNTRSFVGKTST
jgi:hypothetical protein